MLILASLWLCVKGEIFWSFPVQVSGPAPVSLSTAAGPRIVLQRESDSLQMTEQGLEHVT